MLPAPAEPAPSQRSPADAQDIAATASELVACGSLEMGADAPEDARRIAQLLPAGTPVYVNHLPRRELAHTLPALIALADAGLEPVPHVAARRIISRDEVNSFLKQAVRLARVCKVLLIGGDIARPLGPYGDGAALMRDGVLAGCGVQQVGLPGYPEGHPYIAADALGLALAEKLRLAGSQGLGTYVVTQFSFAPSRIIEYCADLARRAADVPVYVGLPGPTSPRTLVRYAQRCGVGASLRALQAQGMGAVRLFTNVDPTDQLTSLARHIYTGSASNVVGVHLYSFGGVATTAHWMNARITSRTP
jgi:methylenetetrahydrofolate reductase (NADPH)